MQPCAPCMADIKGRLCVQGSEVTLLCCDQGLPARVVSRGIITRRLRCLQVLHGCHSSRARVKEAFPCISVNAGKLLLQAALKGGPPQDPVSSSVWQPLS